MNKKFSSASSLQKHCSNNCAHEPKHTRHTSFGSSTRIRRRRCTRRTSPRSRRRRTRARIRRHQGKVRTRQPCRITRMNNHTFIAKEIRASGCSAQIQLLIYRLERRASDIPMLASQIASLARLRGDVLAWVVLAAVGWVEMAHCCCAVSVRGHGQVVDVVDEGPVRGFGREAGEVYGE